GNKMLSADDALRLVEENVRNSLPRYFDLVWIECKARAENNDYNQFLGALGELERLPAEGDGIGSLVELVETAGASATEVEQVKDLINALLGNCQQEPVRKSLEKLLIAKVDWLVASEYEKLKTYDSFEKMLPLIDKVQNSIGVKDRVWACYAECKLRQDKGLSDWLLGRRKDRPEPVAGYLK